MKKIIIVIIVILVIIITGCESKKQEEIEEVKYNTNEKIIEEKEVEELKIEFISLEYKNGTSTLKTRVTNKSEEKTEETYIKIKYKNEKEEIIETQLGYVKALEVGEETILVSNSKSNLSEAKNIEYEVIK